MFAQVTANPLPRRKPDPLAIGVLGRGLYLGRTRWIVMILGRRATAALFNMGPIAQSKGISLWKIKGRTIAVYGVEMTREPGETRAIWVLNFQVLKGV